MFNEPTENEMGHTTKKSKNPLANLMMDSISSSLLSPDNAKRTAAEDKLLEKIQKSSKEKYLSKHEFDKLKKREAKLQQLTMMKL